jgi:hypothetical protein
VKTRCGQTSGCRRAASGALIAFLAASGGCSSDATTAANDVDATTPSESGTPIDSGALDASSSDVTRADVAAEGGPSADGAFAMDAALSGDGGEAMAYAVCLADNSPTFANLRTNLFPVSCMGASFCHSTEQATSATLRGGGGLDLEADVYAHLLGTDGMGAPATNQEGETRNLVRVKPGDPDNSFLLIKLGLMTNNDAMYGSGMPYPTPGSVCPQTRAAIRSWIQAGALNN